MSKKETCRETETERRKEEKGRREGERKMEMEKGREREAGGNILRDKNRPLQKSHNFHEKIHERMI